MAAIARDSSALEPRLLLADEYLRAGRWVEASDAYRAVYRSQPTQRNSLRDTLLVYLAHGDFSSARATLADVGSFARRADLQSTTVALVGAKVLRAQKRTEEVIPILEAAAARNPTDPRVSLELGSAYAELGRREPAAAALIHVLKMPNVDREVAAEAWGDLAWMSLNSSRPATAVYYWDQAMRLDSTYFSKHPEHVGAYEDNRKGTGFSGDSNAVKENRATSRAPMKRAKRGR